MRYIIAVIFLIYVAFLLFMLTSCEVLKTKRSVKSDSTAVSKVDSTRVVKTDDGKRSDSTWWREIINFLPKGDTNNITIPVTNYYPSQIIREGGTVSKEEWMRILDSMNKVKTDTTTVSKTEENKSKETKVLNMWQIIGLCVGCYVVLTLLSKLKISLR